MNLDLGLTESEEMLKKTALDFMRRDAPKDVIQALQETDTGYTEELWRKAVEMGWLGVIIPEQYGGMGNSLTSAGVLFEALGTGPLPGPYFSSGILGSSIILEAGTEEQKRRILPAVTEGEQILTLALTEPEYSWGPGAVQTTATSKNGDFVLDGLKLFTIDAQAATHLIVVARMGKGADPAEGIALFLVISLNRKAIEKNEESTFEILENLKHISPQLYVHSCCYLEIASIQCVRYSLRIHACIVELRSPP